MTLTKVKRMLHIGLYILTLSLNMNCYHTDGILIPECERETHIEKGEFLSKSGYKLIIHSFRMSVIIWSFVGICW